MIRGTYRKGDAIGSTLKPLLQGYALGMDPKTYTERF